MTQRHSFKGSLLVALILFMAGAGLSTAWDSFSQQDLPTKVFVLVCSGMAASGIYWLLRAAFSRK